MSSSVHGKSPIVSKRKAKVVLSIQDKLNILERIDKGETVLSLAGEFGISKSTISKIKTGADKIMMFASKLGSGEGSRNRKSMKGSKFDLLDEALFKWFLQARASGQPISGPLLREMALRLNGTLGGDPKFGASQGWLEKFRSRHGIRQLDIQGEKLSADTDSLLGQLLEEG